MRPYSMDLRQRILADYDAGMKVQKVAEKYCISTKCVRDLRQLREQTGDIAPRKGPTGRKPRLAEHLETLTELVQAQPDATLEELRPQLPVQVSISTLWRALAKLGFTLKKSPACC